MFGPRPLNSYGPLVGQLLVAGHRYGVSASYHLAYKACQFVIPAVGVAWRVKSGSITRNNIGPKILPCDTPLVMAHGAEKQISNNTLRLIC